MERSRVHQQPTELNMMEELPQELDLATALSGVGILSEGHT